MFKKNQIYCTHCSYQGVATKIKSTPVEKAAFLILVILSYLIPQLAIYTVPLFLADLFLPAITICPACKAVALDRGEARPRAV